MKGEYTRRDYLARDRTHFANKRTLLAYWRTALAFFALGGFLIRFVVSTYSIMLTLISMLFGITLFVSGTVTYLKYKEKINNR